MFHNVVLSAKVFKVQLFIQLFMFRNSYHVTCCTTSPIIFFLVTTANVVVLPVLDVSDSAAIK